MTKADKTEIESLLANVNAMRKTEAEANAPYHDEKIAKYAKDAFEDAKETVEYINGVVNHNLGVFFNIKNIQLSTSHYAGNYWVKLRDGEPLTFYFGKYTHITFNVNADKVRNFVAGTYKASFALVDEKGMTAVFARPQTSNTGDKLRDYCAWDDLYYRTLGVLKFALFGKYEPAVWAKIKKQADSTRVQTQYLLDDFKLAVRNIAAIHKERADKAEAAKNANAKCGEYVKVA